MSRSLCGAAKSSVSCLASIWMRPLDSSAGYPEPGVSGRSDNELHDSPDDEREAHHECDDVEDLPVAVQRVFSRSIAFGVQSGRRCRRAAGSRGSPA